MGFENFPYTNFHELNLDWIAKIAKDFLEQYTHIQELIANGEQSLQDLTASGLEDLQEKADALEQLLQEWYNTHSEDIARELARAIVNFNNAADAKAEQTIASIPAEYTELSNAVAKLTKQNVLFNASITWRNGYYIGSAGNYVQYAPFNATEKIPLYDDSGLIRINIFGNVKLNNASYICFYDKNGRFISGVTTEQTGGEFEFSLNTADYPAAYYVAFSNLAAYEPFFIKAAEKAVIGQIYNLLPNKKNLFDPYDTRTQVNKYFDPNGIITLNGFAISHPIPLKGGIEYTLTCARNQFGPSTQIAICDSNGDIISYKENIPVTLDNKMTFTADNDCYALFNISLNETGRENFRICESAMFDTDYEKYTGKLYGKKILYNGDSICESRMTGFSANGGAYPVMIGEITGGTYENRAVGGATLAQSSAPHNICDDITNMSSSGDLICLDGGINDYWNNIPLGEFNPIAFHNTLDLTTITGALESIFRQSIDKWVGKPIVFIIIHKVTGTAFNTNTAGYTFENVRARIIEVCEKYSIPYIDIWGEGGLNPYMDSLNNAYMNGGANIHPDGCHPDAQGYMKYYVPRLIAEFEKILP